MKKIFLIRINIFAIVLIFGSFFCFTPVKAWEDPVPTVYDASIEMLSLEQPGSRIFYISSEGDDNTASVYFWDGESIVDETGSRFGEGGVAYGNDPMSPTGPIKPFRRWVYVSPRRNAKDIGTAWDGLAYMSPGSNRSDTRYEYPDWWLFKRGEVFDLYEEYLSFAQESDPSLTEVYVGGLGLPGGESSDKRQVMGAYGSLDIERPRFINPSNLFISRWNEPVPKHILYQSLHFDGRGERRGSGISFQYQSSEAVNILFEDLWVDGVSQGIVVQLGSPEVTFRRCILGDTYKDSHTSHTQGFYVHGNTGLKFRIEESFLFRNGFSHGDPDLVWPPEGEQIYDIFNRNMYLNGEMDNMNSGLFDSVSLVGASGDQFRMGMQVENNFFYQGYVSLAAAGGHDDSYGPTGSFKNNVLLRFQGKNTEDNRGQPNWGANIGSGSYQVEVSGNIISSAQYPSSSSAYNFSALSWVCNPYTLDYPTRENNVFNNIFDSGTAKGAIKISDGVDSEYVDCAGWSYPGITNNTVRDNILINANGSEYEISQKYSAIGMENDTVFENNDVYVSRQEAAVANGWLDPDRTLKTYMISLGYTVTSVDGLPEYIAEVKKQRRGYFRDELTSGAIVNYIREGFGMEALEIAEEATVRADVDNNGILNLSDALLILRRSLGLSMSGTAWYYTATSGDVKCDGLVGSSDALLLLRYSLGLDMSSTSWCEL